MTTILCISIEPDGGGHYAQEQAVKDIIHTNDLEAMHLTVLRFLNLDIDRHFSSVCEHIDRTVKRSLPQSSGGAFTLARYNTQNPT